MPFSLGGPVHTELRTTARHILFIHLLITGCIDPAAFSSSGGSTMRLPHNRSWVSGWFEKACTIMQMDTHSM